MLLVRVALDHRGVIHLKHGNGLKVIRLVKGWLSPSSAERVLLAQRIDELTNEHEHEHDHEYD
jgi:hypothetical protein